MKFEMMKTAKKLVEVQFGVKPGEAVLIITDTKTSFSITEVLAAAAYSVGAEAMIMIMSPQRMHHEEPPRPVAEAMKAADVVFLATFFGSSHTKAAVDAARAGARIVTMHGVTEDIMMHGAVTADYEKVKKNAERVADLMEAADELRVVSSVGTDITMSIRGRKALRSTGFALEAGHGAAMFPAEAAIAPIEGTANGTIVVDYMLEPPIGLLKEPVVIEVKKGRAMEFRGGYQARMFQEIVEGHDENATNIAEVALGMNDKARLIPFMREVKKKLGTVHIGLGTNFDIGGTTKSNMHTDMLLSDATVYLNGKKILDKHQLLI